jgi:hypothetical protein
MVETKMTLAMMPGMKIPAVLQVRVEPGAFLDSDRRHLIHQLLRAHDLFVGQVLVGLRLRDGGLRGAQLLGPRAGLQRSQRLRCRLGLGASPLGGQAQIGGIDFGDDLSDVNRAPLVDKQARDAPANLEPQIHFMCVHRAREHQRAGVCGLPRPTAAL